MYIDFASHQLTDASTSYSLACRLYGISAGRKYIQRLSVLRATGQFSHLFGLKALKLHPLKGNRKGQYAITLTGNYRLIIEKVEEDRIQILNVEDYRGD